MTCMHLKKFKVFPSLLGPETHFRRAKGHQRAGALSGSIKIFQITIMTVYEVEHQKTVTTKPGIDYLVFRGKHRVLPLLPKKQAGRHKKIESKVALHC